MNKKILVVFVAVLAIAIFVTPVFAKPTKGQKVAITLIWSRTSKVVVDEWVSGKVTHRLVHLTWNVTIKFEDETTLNGTAVEERKVVLVPQKVGSKNVIRVNSELSFPSEGGGFEGYYLLILAGFTGPPPPMWEKSKVHGLFRGTGAFKGQTLNVGHTWKPFGASIGWTGYWLKRYLC